MLGNRYIPAGIHSLSAANYRRAAEYVRLTGASR